MSTSSTEATETGATESTSTETTEQAAAGQTTTEQKPAELPDDHPLVKTLAAQKDQIRELKAQIASGAEGTKTAEQRIASLEQRAQKAERAALVKSVQVQFDVSDEDAALFLTGTDEATLTKQAQRLAARVDEQKKTGPRVPKQGTQTQTKATGDDVMREAVRNLFNN